MDKNKIKSFAIWARRSLIKSVSEKAESIGVYGDKILEATAVQGGFKLEGKEDIFTLSKKDRDALVNQVREKGFEQVMEEVAYTWFNRFMGLRYMEVNDYLPSGVRILSSEVEEKKEPDVLTRVSEIIDELELNSNEIYDLLDTGNTLDREKAYRIILVKQCNELGKIIPQMFEKISDYTELLLPDNLLEDGSVIRKMVEDIEESDWLEEVEIIGWMYQYYIAEEKDRVIQAKKRYKINEIPFATQLFTPKWIVKYMVENSLGRYWIESHSEQDDLKYNWGFYLDNRNNGDDFELKLKPYIDKNLKVEEIKVFDPAMGSAHILVYAFDVLYSIYMKNGYSEREIPTLILNNNLFGLDIDDRAVQLASFALIMKARQYNRRFFREVEKNKIKLNVTSIRDSNCFTNEHMEMLSGNNEEISKVQSFINLFIDSKIYGSLINLDIVEVDIDFIKERLKLIEQESSYTLLDINVREEIINIVPALIKQYEIMNNRYDVLITNPPYMGNQYMPESLVEYINNNYKDVKSDMFTAFIKYSFNKVIENGQLGFITPFVWMFIKSYELLREDIVKNKNISSLIQLEYNSFPEACVPVCTFTLRNYNSMTEGEYIRLSDFKGVEKQPRKVLDAIKKIDVDYRFTNESYKFENIDSYPIAYWVSEDVINSFRWDKLSKIINPRIGLVTGDTGRFLRLWSEIEWNKVKFDTCNSNDAIQCGKKWFPYQKGGTYRKWYGNHDYVVNWENDGYEMKFNNSVNGRVKSHNYNGDFAFKSAITWTKITSSKFAARYSPNGFLFDDAGPICSVNKKNIYYALSLMNSKVGEYYLNLINPTMNFLPGHINSIPFNEEKSSEYRMEIDNLVKENINICKTEWDCFENSWDFKKHPLIKNNELDKIECVFEVWKEKCKEKAVQLENNERRLNEIFIQIYKLNNEVGIDIDNIDVAIRIADRERDIKSFISYAVGCMFGRYSIDSEGLIYAGGLFSDKWQVTSDECLVRDIKKDEEGNVISDSWVDSRFIPDRENIIPITEDEYFEDDIVTRFIEFVRTVYGEETLEENLDFIADSIDRKASETSRQAIRRYFIKDFYKEHLKVYQKRPIYWMFESGKNDGFKCLVYMHRYNEQTVAKVRTDYLHTLQRKYETEINRLQLVEDSEEYTAKDRTSAKKKIDRISKQIEECRGYDQVVAYLANEKISIDLDDGVKVNYDKFQDIKVINSKGKETKMNLLAKI